MNNKKNLSPEAYRITQECGTEPPFTGEYYNHNETGNYHCICCDAVLFESLQSMTLEAAGLVFMTLPIVAALGSLKMILWAI